jgi:hypothetical protein
MSVFTHVYISSKFMLSAHASVFTHVNIASYYLLKVGICLPKAGILDQVSVFTHAYISSKNPL